MSKSTNLAGSVRLIAPLLLCSSGLHSADASLTAIRNLLVPMRSRPPAAARGATPALTQVKHRLRDWIEKRLPALSWDGSRWNPDPVVLQEQLNQELQSVGLLWDLSSVRSPERWTQLGFLGRITFGTQSGILVVRTAAGIQQCGYDESAYAYEADGRSWRRIWQSERNDYRETTYLPQMLDEVRVSPSDFRPDADQSEHLILTLGTDPWCTSTWHPVYYRIWRINRSSSQPVLLLDESHDSFIGSTRGAATQTGVWIEYAVSGVAPGIRQPELRHYTLQSGRLDRVDPVALTPRDFTNFWLAHPWSESAKWTADDSRTVLAKWRQEHPGPFVAFSEPTKHCIEHPDIWQVRVDRSESAAVYLLMRWRPPDSFTMISASDRPSPDCTEIDRRADEPRSLFDLR